MKTYKEVFTSDRLPQKDGIYFILNKENHKAVFVYSEDTKSMFLERANKWYEEVEYQLESEEIYPKDKRVDINFDVNRMTNVNERILTRNGILSTKALESSESKVIKLLEELENEKSNNLNKIENAFKCGRYCMDILSGSIEEINNSIENEWKEYKQYYL
jgi:predicted class III extradiol MEMO1 family dioxygenase